MPDLKSIQLFTSLVLGTTLTVAVKSDLFGRSTSPMHMRYAGPHSYYSEVLTLDQEGGFFLVFSVRRGHLGKRL